MVLFRKVIPRSRLNSAREYGDRLVMSATDLGRALGDKSAFLSLGWSPTLRLSPVCFAPPAPGMVVSQ